jgi:hypothetical protein
MSRERDAPCHRFSTKHQAATPEPNQAVVRTGIRNPGLLVRSLSSPHGVPWVIRLRLAARCATEYVGCTDSGAARGYGMRGLRKVSSNSRTSLAKYGFTK